MSGMTACFLISSDEQLLKNERSQAVIAEAKKAMPHAQFRLFTHTELRGKPMMALLQQELIEQGGLLFGLDNPDPLLAAEFSTDRIIKIYLDKIDQTAVDVMTLIARSLRPGVCVIVDLPRLNYALKKISPAPWREPKSKVSTDTRLGAAIAAIFHQGGSLDILYPGTGEELVAWTAQRAGRMRLRLPEGGAAFLAQAAEGNLTAIDQALKTAATLEGGDLTLEDLTAIMSQDSHFTGFELPEAVETPNAVRALNIISSLAAQGSFDDMLRSQLPQLDRMLVAIAKARAEGFATMPTIAKEAFFKQNKMFTKSAKAAFTKAVTAMPDFIVRDLIACLAQSAKAGAIFNGAAAVRALTRFCVCTHNSAAGGFGER